MRDTEFVADVRAAVAAWASAPLLPTIFMGLALVVVLSGFLPTGATVAITITVNVFAHAFRATVRVWFVRLYRGGSLTGPGAWSLSWAFLGRTIRLTLIAAPVFVVMFAIGDAVARAAGASDGVAAGSGFLVAASVAGALLTFVVPALALSTPSAVGALRSGLSALRHHFRHAAAYVLVPAVLSGPLYVAAIYVVRVAAVLGVLVVAVVYAFGLTCIGAITAYYIRHIDASVTENGSLDVRVPPRKRAPAWGAPGPVPPDASTERESGTSPEPRAIIVMPGTGKRWRRGRHH